MFKPCLIIPIYNHGNEFKKFIPKLTKYKIPIIIIDDGSKTNTKEILKQIHKQEENVFLFTLKENQGKGAAFIKGIKEAYKLNFTHALQIDADGQHNPKDINKFLSKAKENKNALINGTPIYDENAPKSRTQGRKITNFWIAIETLSFDIKDAMCGFRVYPIEKIIKLIKTTNISKRMTFDIEIIVKLHWAGIKIINIPTKIKYPKSGTSNFRMLKDNLQISYLHTKLCILMLLKLPKILLKKFKKTKN